MDIALRIIHIVFSVFWAGTVIFATLILIPQLRALGPAIERPTMKALLRITSPTMMVSSLIVLGTGIAIALRMHGGSLDTFLTTGWGLAMFTGFIAVVIAVIIGFGVMAPAGFRMEKLGRSIEGRDPTPDEAQQLDRLNARVRIGDRINFVLILIALVAMPVSRFV